MESIFNHRSVRKYKSDPVPEAILEQILTAATRASNTGNMQVYSIVVTTDPEIKAQLSPCHFGQPMVTQAPVVMTFCADVSRFSAWCKLRGAEPVFDNFLWFMNGAIDCLLAAQNACITAEELGLGICYLGTTTYMAEEISNILGLPAGVAPVTTVVMGYPQEIPALVDRLPLKAVVHRDTYKPYSDQQINELWREREASEETANLLRANSLPNLARIFTENRYKGEDNIKFSEKYFEFLKRQGFFNQ